MKKLVISFLCLFVVWLLLSGYLKTNLLVLGALSCLLVSITAIRLKIFSENNEHLNINLRAVFYLPWLLKEIVKSNLHVARLILDPELPVKPQSLWIETQQKTDTALAIHANSITLTPGTISLEVEDKKIHVHAVSDHTAQGVKDGEIDKRVAKLENFIK